MRAIRFIQSISSLMLMTVVVIISVLVLGTLVTAQAKTAATEDYRAVYPNSWQKGINKACPKGSAKMFIATLSVDKPNKITEFGEMYLERKNGKFFVDEGSRVNKRTVEFYFFPKGRKAKILLNNFEDSLTYATYTGFTYSFALRMQCNEKMDNMPPGS